MNRLFDRMVGTKVVLDRNSHMTVWVGTSGWHYEHWKGPFYPADMPASAMLRFYAERFRCVEINNSFYKLPSRETFAAWRMMTPPDFLFVVKASRFITHMKKLKDPAEPIQRLFDRIAGLGRKLGPILFQLPPHWPFNRERLAAFLEALPSGHRYVFEFRHDSWFGPDSIDLLRGRNAAFCIFELAGRRSPVTVTADFVYVRLHGPSAAAYQGRYSDGDLVMWANRATAWEREGRDVYVFFDNDQAGYAAQDAARLRDLLARRVSASGRSVGGRRARTRRPAPRRPARAAKLSIS